MFDPAQKLVERAQRARFAARAGLCGCTVGPDYRRPDIDVPATWRLGSTEAERNLQYCVVGPVPGSGPVGPRAHCAREQQGSEGCDRQRRSGCCTIRHRSLCTASASRCQRVGDPPGCQPSTVVGAPSGGQMFNELWGEPFGKLRIGHMGQAAARDRIVRSEPARERTGQGDRGADACWVGCERLHPTECARPAARDHAANLAEPGRSGAAAERAHRGRRRPRERLPASRIAIPGGRCPACRSSSARSRSRRTSSACCSDAILARSLGGETSTR